VYLDTIMTQGMLLPEILHLPAVMLLMMTAGSGITIIMGIPFAVHVFHSSFLLALATLILSAIANLTVWYGFRVARASRSDAKFLGFTRNIWLIGIPLSYFSGIAFGVYLLVLFYF